MRQALPIDRGDETASGAVAERIARAGSGRLATSMIAVVEHIHRIILELRPTRAEWREAIGYLTAIGDATTDNRQEWVLLADLIGATALVEAINSRRPEGATPNAPRGPFYRPDAPHLANGANISLDGRGEPLSVKGRVVDLDACPIAGAMVETWQANGEGFFENQQPDDQPDCNLRGVFTTDAKGEFDYLTVKPASYSVPADGPAGKLLDALDCAFHHRSAKCHEVTRDMRRKQPLQCQEAGGVDISAVKAQQQRRADFQLPLPCLNPLRIVLSSFAIRTISLPTRQRTIRIFRRPREFVAPGCSSRRSRRRLDVWWASIRWSLRPADRGTAPYRQPWPRPA